MKEDVMQELIKLSIRMVNLNLIYFLFLMEKRLVSLLLRLLLINKVTLKRKIWLKKLKKRRTKKVKRKKKKRKRNRLVRKKLKPFKR